MTFLSEYDIIPTASHHLLLAHLNCRSIVLVQNFDIIAISETWPSILSKVVEISGHFFIRQDRVHKSGGGVRIPIRKGINHRSLMNQLPQPTCDGLEQLWTEVCLKSHKLIIGVLYKPPHINYSSLSDLDDTLSTLHLIANEIVFMGDLNINMLKPYADDTTCKTVCSRDIRNIDVALFDELCNTVDWTDVEGFEDIDPILNETFTCVLDVCAPYKTRITRRQSPPWITSNIKYMTKLRNRAYSAYKCMSRKLNHNPNVLNSKWLYYKQLRNLVTFSIRQEEKAYIEFKLKSLKNTKD
nr:unnamed protein product [Callosobruchus analis]